MWNFIIALAALLLIAAAGILVYAATLPTTFRVSRSIRIAAPPDAIFGMINSLSGFRSWEPFSRKDPAIKITYAAPDSGKGAAYNWQGNGQVGEGRVEIVDSKVPVSVTMKLDMLKPMEAHNTVVFLLEPTDGGGATLLTWTMTGERPYIGKLIDAVMNMDRMVGREFETGLAKLKALVESQPL